MSITTLTQIPLTEFNQILQTNSSPEIIVALLNEREKWYSSLQKTPHFNQKYVYPYWKECKICGAPFMTHNSTQALRNQRCPKCPTGKDPKIKKPLSERKMSLVTCAECGKEFYKHNCYLKNSKEHFCSYHCNGKARGREWAKHGYKGGLARTPESFMKAAMRGEKNPAWKGGVTYRNRKGNYVTQPIRYVRCPQEFISMARRDGYVMEHRLVVAQAIGRPLLRTEVVHHDNHKATDNRVENLMLFRSNRDHKLYEHHGFPEPIWRGSNPFITRE